MPNYGTITPEIIKQRIKEEEERFLERKKAMLARAQALITRKKLVRDLKTWMERRKITVVDVLWMAAQLRPKRADKPVKSKKPLHPDVRAARGPTAHQGGIGSRGGKMPMKGDPALMAAVRKARLEKDWDSDQLGAKLGVSGATVANWETGRYTPKEETRQKLVKLLGLPPGLGAEATAAAQERSANGVRARHAAIKANGAAAHQ